MPKRCCSLPERNLDIYLVLFLVVQQLTFVVEDAAIFSGKIKHAEMLANKPPSGKVKKERHSFTIPSEMICPITREIMTDPVQRYISLNVYFAGHHFRRVLLRARSNYNLVTTEFDKSFDWAQAPQFSSYSKYQATWTD